MRKVSKKGLLLFAAAMASCALAMPSTASAASWTALGTEHTLDSPDFGFTVTTVIGPIIAQCTNSTLTGSVTSSANMEITNATFGGDCTALVNQGAGNMVCTVDRVATRLPWTATALSTNNIQIHGVHIDVTYTQSSVGNCPAALVGTVFTVTGTLSGGTYNNTERALILSNTEGLTTHSLLGNNLPLTWRGTFRDTSQSLIVD